MSTTISIVRVTLDHLEELVPLFDSYRVFYRQPSDIEASRAFLADRIKLEESVIFLAYVDGKPAGFTQLYPTFSSSTLQRFYILNDLFTLSEFRGLGVGKALLDRAKQLVVENNMKGLALETEVNNPAQKLYEREGWKKDEEYLHYFWSV